jgi:uncharacterized membrane protein YcgQ (UPF0703/DUF1980 family)
MKKIFAKNRYFIYAIFLIAAVFASGCSRAWENIDVPEEQTFPGSENRQDVPPAKKSAASSNNGGIIEMKEKLFISQVNDVYVNTEDYLGKTIKIEGIFKEELYPEKEEPYRFVIRYGPGCCGYDGNVGFEVAWAKEKNLSYPEVDSWVEAVGVVKTYEENEGFQYIYLDLVSLDVSNDRGAEIVNQ